MTGIRHLFWDFDGTLYDSYPAMTVSFLRGQKALGARERGVFVIALTSLAHSRAVTPRNPEGLRLFEAADLVLDNGGVLGDAVWQAEDGGRVGPTSTAMGAAILQAIVCRVKELSLAEGWKADFFLSSNVDGGDAVKGALLERYGDIPGLR